MGWQGKWAAGLAGSVTGLGWASGPGLWALDNEL